MARYPNRKSFPKTKVIICEGHSDEAFFRALLTHAQITTISVRNCADADPTNRGGIDKFRKMLTGMVTWDGFPALTDIVLVADADTDPVVNFQRVINQITAATPETIPPTNYGVPTQVQQKAGGSPASVSVLLLPGQATPGNIETLCLRAASRVNPSITACVDQLATCAGLEQWQDQTKVDKLKLSSTISCQHQTNPGLGLGNVWRDAPHLVPISDPCFDHIVTYLRNI